MPKTKNLMDKPLHKIFMEYRAEGFGGDALWNAVVYNNLVSCINDDFDIKTLRQYYKEMQEGLFLYNLQKVWDIENDCPGFLQLSTLIHFFFEWKNGQKYFALMPLVFNIDEWHEFLEKTEQGIIKEKNLFKEFDPLVAFKEIKERMEKVFAQRAGF